MFHSSCFAFSVISSIIILFMWKVYTASLCSNGWLDVKCIVASVLCGFSVNSSVLIVTESVNGEVQVVSVVIFLLLLV